MGSEPKIIAIDNDDYHALHVGKTSEGRQFFLTTPFDPGGRLGAGGEFVALYLFDSEGRLIEAVIDSFGPRESMNLEARDARYNDLLRGLGEVDYCRIEVAPFSVDRFNLQFGLIVREPEEEDDPVAVEVQPGNYMAFFEPWDSGEYDT
jgi:hypothetical protein